MFSLLFYFVLATQFSKRTTWASVKYRFKNKKKGEEELEIERVK